MTKASSSENLKRILEGVQGFDIDIANLVPSDSTDGVDAAILENQEGEQIAVFVVNMRLGCDESDKTSKGRGFNRGGTRGFGAFDDHIGMNLTLTESLSQKYARVRTIKPE